MSWDLVRWWLDSDVGPTSVCCSGLVWVADDSFTDDGVKASPILTNIKPPLNVEPTASRWVEVGLMHEWRLLAEYIGHIYLQ